MTRHLPKSVIIVDRSRASAYRLRSALVKSNVTAHVFNNFAAALRMMERKAIDSVVVEFDTDRDTVDFCKAAKVRNVPVVFSSGPLETRDLGQNGVNVTFQALPKAPKMFVSYPLAKVRSARTAKAGKPNSPR